MFNRCANISLELILAVFIMGVCSLLATQSFQLFAYHDAPFSEPVALGMMQLQELVAMSEIVEVSENEVLLLYQNEEVSLSQSNDFLARTPGFVIYLHPVDHVRFWFEDELLMVSFVWKDEHGRRKQDFQSTQKEYQYVLGKKEWWRD